MWNPAELTLTGTEVEFWQDFCAHLGDPGLYSKLEEPQTTEVLQVQPIVNASLSRLPLGAKRLKHGWTTRTFITVHRRASPRITGHARASPGTSVHHRASLSDEEPEILSVRPLRSTYRGGTPRSNT